MPRQPNRPAHEPDDPARLKQAVRGGAGAMIVAQVAAQAVQLAIVACLYRLLTPGDYGLFWLAVPWVLFLRLFSSVGLNVATVQRGELSEAQLTSAFWLSIYFGLATAAATAALAPALAWFYDSPELARLILALAPTSLLAACGAQHQALLERHLRFRVLSITRFVAQLLGGAAAVVAAVSHAGVWALAIQWYVELGALAAMVWIVEPWRPLRPGRGAGVGELLRFGGYYTASNVLFYLGQNIDKVMLGYFLAHSSAHSEDQLGLYSQAFNLMLKPVFLITTPLLPLVLPGLSRAAGNAALYRDLLFGFTRLIALVLMPAGVGLAIVAPEAMVVLGGPQWLAAGELLRILSLAIVVQGLVNAAGSMLASVGRTDRLFFGALLMTLILAQAFAVGLWFGDRLGEPAAGLAASYTVAMVVVIFVPYMIYTLRSIGIGPWSWFAQLRTPLVASIAMGIVVIAWRRLLASQGEVPPIVALATEIMFGIAAFAWFARRDLSWFRGQLRRLLAGDD